MPIWLQITWFLIVWSCVSATLKDLRTGTNGQGAFGILASVTGITLLVQEVLS